MLTLCGNEASEVTYEYGASSGPEARGVAQTSRPPAFSLGISVVKEAAGKAALGLYLGFGQCLGWEEGVRVGWWGGELPWARGCGLPGWRQGTLRYGGRWGGAGCARNSGANYSSQLGFKVKEASARGRQPVCSLAM